jgi:hypothetical protein
MHAPLMIKAFDGALHVSPRELFNNGLQLRVALTHDPVEMRGADSSFLELVIGPTGVDCLMLANVAHEQHAVVRPRRSRNVCICFVLARLDSSRT